MRQYPLRLRLARCTSLGLIPSLMRLRRRALVSALGLIAKALKVPVEHLLGEEPAAAKRVPTPKLERQIDQVATLPRAQQQFVSQFPDTVLKQSP